MDCAGEESSWLSTQGLASCNDDVRNCSVAPGLRPGGPSSGRLSAFLAVPPAGSRGTRQECANVRPVRGPRRDRHVDCSARLRFRRTSPCSRPVLLGRLQACRSFAPRARIGRVPRSSRSRPRRRGPRVAGRWHWRTDEPGWPRWAFHRYSAMTAHSWPRVSRLDAAVGGDRALSGGGRLRAQPLGAHVCRHLEVVVACCERPARPGRGGHPGCS